MKNFNKIAIIGGTGKAGRYIAKKALENGFQVRLLVRNPDKLTNIDERIEIIQGDVQNNKSILSLLIIVILSLILLDSP